MRDVLGGGQAISSLKSDGTNRIQLTLNRLATKSLLATCN